MYTLFNATSDINQGIVKFPEWTMTRDGLKRNLGLILSYHRKNPTAVKSNHFLVRLLHSITIPQSQNLERYYYNVDSLALNMSMALKMTSPIYRGVLFQGVFYGPEVSEVLIANNAEFDFEAAHRNWRNLAPIQVLYHPVSHLAMNLPDGQKNGSESGFAVISINIPMLAVQYRAFRLNEIAVAESDSQRSIMQFLRMYPIPNMLYSHLDLALMNRISNMYTGAPQGASSRAHSFYVPDYTPKVTQVYDKVLGSLERAGKNFAGVLKSIPGVILEDMEQTLELPKIAPTQQVIWALVMARLAAIEFLLRTTKEHPKIRNQREVNRILKDILFFKTNRTFATVLPRELYLDVQYSVDGIKAMAEQAW